jgi:L-threonylcarbamoyladenylate synthase
MADIISLNKNTDFSPVFKLLQREEIIAFPTDTVYGIGVLLSSRSGIQKLFIAKARSPQKAIAVLIGNMDQLPLVVEEFPQTARILADHYWPGAVTMVLPKRQDLPENISPYPTIGVRMPNHPLIQEMLNTTGPLATTSANLSGGADPTTAEEVNQQLGDNIQLILDGGKIAGGLPSTVIDCTQTPPAVLRQGAIKPQDIEILFGKSKD